MNRYILDFETTFSKENTLTTKSIEAYVRDPKFEVIGAGIRDCQTGKKEWLNIDHFYAWCLGNKIPEKGAFICHHTQFDGFVLCNETGICPAYWYDTLSMSRALYPRLPSHSLESMIEHLHLGTPKEVPYNLFRGKTLAEIKATPGLEEQIAKGCLHDVELTAKLFSILHPLMPQSELDLIDAMVRLFTEPKLIGDIPILEDCLADAIYEREHLPEKLGVHKSVLLSDRKFASLLTGLGVEPPKKISSRTGKSIFALAKSDKAFTDLKEHENATVRDYINARIAVKTSIGETRAARLLDAAQRGPLPVYLRYYGAHTGRPSGGDKVNLLNLPNRSKLRNGLRSPDGYTLIWADYAQIECRILACLSGCKSLREAFREGRDIYSEFGTRLFGCEVSRTVRPEFRYLSKKTILGCGYGMGSEKFMNTVNADARNFPEFGDFQIDLETAGLAVNTYRRSFPEVPMFWKYNDVTLISLANGVRRSNLICNHQLGIDGQRIILPNDLFLDYTGLQYVTPSDNLWEQDQLLKEGAYKGYKVGNQKIWGGVLTENICQALAWIITANAWLELKKAGLDIVLPIYDALIFLVRKEQEKRARILIEELMTMPPAWMPELPLSVEIKSGVNYGQEDKN